MIAMIHKIYLLCIVIIVVQSQDYNIGNIESVTEDPIAAFKDELQQKVSDKKADVISHIKSYRQQYNSLLGDLEADLEVVRNTFILELENLTQATNYVATLAEENGKDVSSCNSNLLLKINEANLRLDVLDLNLIDTNSTLKKLGKKIGTLSKEIGNYKKVMKNCKVSTDFAANVEEADTCATDHIETVDKKVDKVKQSVTDDITNVEADVKGLIGKVDNEIRNLISEAVGEFGNCIDNMLA